MSGQGEELLAVPRKAGAVDIWRALAEAKPSCRDSKGASPCPSCGARYDGNGHREHVDKSAN